MPNLKRLIISLLILTAGAAIFVPCACAGEDFHKGMCFVAWDKERYSSTYSDASLAKLAETKTEWVQIVTTYYQDTYNSKVIYRAQKTPSDTSLRHVIGQAHKLGLKVMLKPHIDLVDSSSGLWRGDIGFQTKEDWQAWFSEYSKFILHYAKLAEETRVELFCIGTELSFASQQAEFWQDDIIPEVRRAYSGALTYAANWDEYKSIRFWQSLDYCGIDAYFPLANKDVPTYLEIESGCRKWAAEIEEWQARVNKPVIFTEIGFRSCQFSASRPWDSAFAAKADTALQADCYQAVLNTFVGEDWFKGIYWWYWKTFPYAGGQGNRDFTPQNKPAEIVLTNWYKGLSPVTTGLR